MSNLPLPPKNKHTNNLPLLPRDSHVRVGDWVVFGDDKASPVPGGTVAKVVATVASYTTYAVDPAAVAHLRAAPTACVDAVAIDDGHVTVALERDAARRVDVTGVYVACRLGLVLRGEGVASLRCWARDNEDADDVDAMVATLLRGEVVRGGGGAAPEYTVERVYPTTLSEAELDTLRAVARGLDQVRDSDDDGEMIADLVKRGYLRWVTSSAWRRVALTQSGCVTTAPSDAHVAAILAAS